MFFLVSDDELPYISRGNSHCSTSSICSYNSDNEESFTEHTLDHLKAIDDEKAIAYRPLNPMVKNLLSIEGSLSDDENFEDFAAFYEEEPSPFVPRFFEGRKDRNHDSESFCREFKNLSTAIPSAPCEPPYSFPPSACTTAEKSSFIRSDTDLSIDCGETSHDITKHSSFWAQLASPSFHLGESDHGRSHSSSSSGKVRTKKRHRTPTTCSPLLPSSSSTTAAKSGDGSHHSIPHGTSRSRSSSMSTSSQHNLNSSASSSPPNFLFRSIPGSSRSNTGPVMSSPHSLMEGICLDQGSSSIDCMAEEITMAAAACPEWIEPFNTHTSSPPSTSLFLSCVGGNLKTGIASNEKRAASLGSISLKGMLPEASGSSYNSIAAATISPTGSTTTTTTTKQLQQRRFKRHALMRADEEASFFAQSNLLHKENIIS